ncbi:mucin-2 [Cydia pomonella]|uniref:mucin-2 n=1 Tax=Cydia pomonella TaxID=82600 RepID=UPI002ADD7EEB|nr:mucin-2 [Cydia pomonella]
MYKTVRHGENSLQYTILPQTEEVLNNSGLKGKGRDYSPSIHVRHSRKRSSVKYILLVIFGIIVALALASIPLYVMNGALYARKSQQNVITSSPHTPGGREIVKSRKKDLKEISPELLSTLMSKLESTSATVSPTTVTTTVATTVVSERATTPPWTMPALRSWKSSTSSTTIPPIPTEDNEEIPLIGTPSGSIRRLDQYMSNKPWGTNSNNVIPLKPTVTPEPTVRNMYRYYSRSFVPSVKTPTDPPKVFEDVLITTKGTTTVPFVTTEITTTSDNARMSGWKDTLLSFDDDETFKSLEADEVFSLPPLKPDTAADGDEVTVSKAGDGTWYGARWPFVDTSSYFQWTGYSPGDNLLLPLLVAALSSIALVLLLALAVRKRKRSLTASAIGLTSDLQADDNTNLLTAENPEDAEE